MRQSKRALSSYAISARSAIKIQITLLRNSTSKSISALYGPLIECDPSFDSPPFEQVETRKQETDYFFTTQIPYWVAELEGEEKKLEKDDDAPEIVAYKWFFYIASRLASSPDMDMGYRFI